MASPRHCWPRAASPLLLPALLLQCFSRLGPVLAVATGGSEDSNSDAETCSAAGGDGGCATRGSGVGPAGVAYYWPQQKGDLNRTGLSPYSLGIDLQSGPTWRWKDPHLDVITSTPLIDGQKNIYLSTRGRRIYKFSPDGRILWTFRGERGPMDHVPVIMGGSLYGSTRAGFVFAIDMETGKERWATQVSNATGTDSACLFAADGLVLSATAAHKPAGNNAVVALSAADGSHRWTFRHAWPTWNFQASSPGDGTVVFQDLSGGLYRLSLATGKLLYEAGVRVKSVEMVTTGAAVVGPNSLVYVVTNTGLKHGVIHAYRLKDGGQVWLRDVGLEANQAVAIGQLAGKPGLAVVAGVGKNPGYPAFLRWAWWMMLSLPLWTLSCCALHACRCARGRPCWGCGRWLLSAVALSVLLVGLPFLMHAVSLRWEGHPMWLFRSSLQPGALVALDADTGRPRWTFRPPAFDRPATLSDEHLLLARLRNEFLADGSDSICFPDSWSQAVISGDGTVYAGYTDGRLYAVRDANGDGRIDGEAGEVASFDVAAGFQASQAIAPGMLAAAPCGGGLFVWRS